MPADKETNSVQELSGWKEIAAYLRVSIRTAQKLEVQQGLPVRRGAGQKGPVYASPAELDEWRKRPRIVEAASENSPPPIPASPGTNRRHFLRDSLLLGSGGLLVAGLAAALSKLNRVRGRVAASYQVRGRVLSVYDQNNQRLWDHTFPEPINAGEPCLFTDLEGAGRNDTLFVRAQAKPEPDTTLMCFNAEGSVVWEFVPGRDVVDNLGRRFVPPYHIAAVLPFRLRSSKVDGIFVESIHYYSFPSQLAVLDGQTGKIRSEYWHRGHLRHAAVADIDGDGVPEILAGGVNDAPEYKQATLLAFDPRDISGATPRPQGGSYFAGMKAKPAKRTVLFPKSPISGLEEFNIVRGIHVHPEGVVVAVAEGTDEPLAPGIAYEFDRMLNIRNVLLEDSFQNRLLELQRAGKLPKETPEAIAERLKRAVTVI